MEREIYGDWVLRCSTHVELLRRRAQYHPERRAYTFLPEGEMAGVHLTFAELDSQARAIATLLQANRASGQPVLLLYQPGLEYLAAFFGCLYAGAIAVPAYPPRLNHNLERLEAIVSDAQPILALSSKAVATTAMRKQFSASSHLGNLPIEVTDSLPESFANQWREPLVSGETLAFLQYTSGSTGKPKGVMVSQQNLLYNHRMFQEALQHPADAPFVCWLPLFHDMGLIGNALQAMYLGAPCIFMSPFAFLQKPFRWLHAISHYKAYSAIAPNFAYDLCVQTITREQRATLDLSQWHNAVNGAEPIRNETLERFSQTFATCGFRRETFMPGYGLAEATLFVSASKPEAQRAFRTVQAGGLEQHRVITATSGEKHSRAIVNCGQTRLEQKIVIVDPETQLVCPPDQVGEIWISGLNVAQGYWKRLEATKETFQAHLAETGEGPFMRTGDMGFLDHGELFVTGRLKDLIIIRGQNYYPQDIEMAAERSHPALRPNCNAAFSLDIAGEEHIILAQELERQYRHQEPKEVFSAIRQAVFEEYGLHIYGIVLIKPGSIPKTSSGKVQRMACREAFLTQRFSILFADLSKPVIELIEQTEKIAPSQGEQTQQQPASVERKAGEAREDRASSIQSSNVRSTWASSAEQKTMQFSLLYFASNDAALAENKYELLLEGARFADQHDFTAVWIPERHFHPFGGLYPNPSVLAAALAVTTSNIRLRAGSVVLPMHHPARVAEEWSVIDNLSSGRVDIAFATGWNPNDFVLSPENYAQRKELLFSGIEAFHKLWQGDSIIWPNGLGRETATKIYPQPKQRKLTPWITCTGNPERFVEAGMMGANVLTGLLFQSVDELAEKIKLYREARARHGHDPESGKVTLMLHTFVGDDLEEVRRKVREPFTAYLESSVDLWRHGHEKLDNLTPQEREQVLSYAFERYFQTHALFGTPQSCEKMIERLREAGVDEIASLIDFGLDVDTVLDGLHWLNVLRKRCWKGNRSKQRETVAATSSEQSSQPVNSLQQAEKNQSQPQIRTYLRQQIAQALERSAEEFTDLTNIRSLGLDSLKVMSIVNNCQRDLQVTLDAGQFYELTSFDSLANYVAEAYNQSQGQAKMKHLASPTQFVVPRQERQIYFPQSFAQQRMWFLSQLRPGTVAYNVPNALHIDGHINRAALKWSLEEIVRRHEILRTTFAMRQEQPVQIINPPAPFSLAVVDLGTLDLQARERELQKRMLEEAQQPFDLVAGPLLRGTLFLSGAQESLLLLTYHHIVADGWSRGIFLRELQTCYTSFVTGRPSPLEELPIQYADYTVWQREWLQSPAPGYVQPLLDGQGKQEVGREGEETQLAKQLAYWKQQLAGTLPVLELPLDHPRPSLQTFNGAHQAINLPEQLMKELKALSERAGTTLFMTLLASFQILLARYSGQEDILVGSPIASRGRAETEALIGFFANMLVLRADLSGNPSFQEVLRRVRSVCLEAYAHQELPFEQVVEAVYPSRDLSRSPLFQVVFVLDEASWWLDAEMAGLHLRQVEMESGISAFDLTWSVTTRGFGTIEYNRDLFEKDTIVRLLEHWYELLYAIVADPLQRLADISLLPAAQRQQMLVSWNATQKVYRPALCLHQLFEEQVRRAPTAIAIKTPEISLTYQEVEERANQLAQALCHMGMGVDARIGVCMGRVPEAFVSLLGILKAGGIYVPLDPRYPQERLAFMIEDAQVSLLLTQKSVRDHLPEQERTTLCLEPAWFQETSEPAIPLSMDITPDRLAYIIYTSGSTGLPKGVQVSHRGIHNLVEVQKQNFALQPVDHILQFSSLSFDASIWEVCMSLCTGAMLCLEAEHILLAGPALEEAIKKFAITVITLPPSILASLSPEGLPLLRTAIAAGEACSSELVAHWARGRRFFNAYGPTEATVCATMEECTVDTQKPSIGRPITNTQTYLLDRFLQPVPIGVPGELYIGGSGLAYGYFNRPHLTGAHFIPHPFSSQAGERLYKTGDRGRYHSDGTIEFLGRVDNQVKIRGHRVEPGEIEIVLLQHPAIHACAVIVQDTPTEDKQLVAYVVFSEKKRFSSEDMRGYARQHLPEYMVPTIVHVLESMPLTPNGKVDRASLPAAEIVREQEATRVLPSNASEQVIAHIWQEYLRLEKIGREENFFDLGGHSLLIVQVFQKLRNYFPQEIALTDLFKYPTVSALARYLDQTERQAQLAQTRTSALQERQAEALFAGKNRLKKMRLSTSERVNE